MVSVAGIYNACKDLFLFMKGRQHDIKALEERISELINLLSLITSEKEKLDASLGNSVATVETPAYVVTKAEIAVITNRFIKFIDKYAKSTTNQLTSTTVLNASTASLMIHQLNDLKSKVMTKDFFKVAKLSRDVVKLNTRASAVIAKFKRENFTQEKSEPVQDKFFGAGAGVGDSVLPVFDTYVDDVLEHLRGGGDTVGISGRKGAGKTTVLKKLHDRVLDQRSEWGKVIWIEYPAPETETETHKIIEKLQKVIVPQLRIHDFREATSDINQNANAISKFLRQRKYILLMDQVTTWVDLEKLGLRENQEHMKVVIGSRESDVINKMAQIEVKIEGLTRGDAWELFRSVYGEELHDANRRSIVDNMMEYCGWTTGMVRCIASHFKRRKAPSYSWDLDMKVLKSESRSHGLFDDLGDFDKVYEMVYQGLEMEARRCLLYGALFPYRYEIYTDYLIECWIAEGLIGERADQKVRYNRQIGQRFLNHLTGVYLLEWYANTGEKYVTMSPDFRRVALKLKYRDGDETCVSWVPKKHLTPDNDDWRTVTRMSLIECRLRLPDNPECDRICTLLLQSLKPSLEHLAPAFFSHMKSLQLLDLSHTKIGALPESIKWLTDLKGLYLNDCNELVALPDEAKKLVKIEFLDISRTSIPTLPEDIGWMVGMRCLRASPSPMIPSNIITRLTNLEELRFDTTFDFQQEVAVAEGLAGELASLEHLNTLTFNFPNVRSLDTFVTRSIAMSNTDTSWETCTFRSFKISIGSHQTRRPDEPDLVLADKWLRYLTNEEFSEPCQKLLKQASAFEIIGYDDLKSLSSFDLHSVKVCVVERCSHLENIVVGNITSARNQGLKTLEKLCLYDLGMLNCIWTGPVHSTGLVSLKAIKISGCPNLQKILDPVLARSLQSLQFLRVENCDKISKIIDAGHGEQGELLQNLREIELLNLPLLGRICESESISISCKWLKSITVLGCNSLSNLSLALTNNARKRPLIRCGESWWRDSLELSNEMRERLLPVYHFEEEEASASGRSITTSISNMSAIQSGREASTSGRGSEITEHITLSNGASTSNMDAASASGRGSEITHDPRMMSYATSMSDMNGAPQIGEATSSSSASGSPEVPSNRVGKGCFLRCG